MPKLIEAWELLECRECESHCKLILSVESLEDPSEFPSMCVFKNAEIAAKWVHKED